MLRHGKQTNETSKPIIRKMGYPMDERKQSIPLVIIPEADDPGCARVMVDGSVNGHPYRFLLDTAAARTQLVRDRFTQSLEAKRAVETGGVFASTKRELVTVKNLHVGFVKEATTEVERGESQGRGGGEPPRDGCAPETPLHVQVPRRHAGFGAAPHFGRPAAVGDGFGRASVRPSLMATHLGPGVLGRGREHHSCELRLRQRSPRALRICGAFKGD